VHQLQFCHKPFIELLPMLSTPREPGADRPLSNLAGLLQRWQPQHQPNGLGGYLQVV
jgi:hypothetical protein